MKAASEPEGWIAAVGPRAVNADAEDITIPAALLDDGSLSLTAKGLYALVLSLQGQPLNPRKSKISALRLNDEICHTKKKQEGRCCRSVP